jgi:flagellar biosynthesis protein FlhG
MIVITDQATKLRMMVDALTPHARTITVTSGKGGVGKSNIALNMAIAAARLGHRVTLVDADLGLANIDVLTDLRARYNISHVITGRKSIVEIVADGPGGIKVIPGASGLPGLADLADDVRERLIAQLEYLESSADLVIVDTGAGVSRNVMDFVAAADDVVVVATPEPTSITDAYAAIKVLSREADYGNVFVLMNMVSGGGEAGRIANQIIRVSRDFLGLCVEYAGYIVRDEAVEASVRSRRPFILAYPGSPASRCLRKTLDALEIQRRKGERRKKSGFFRRLFRRFRSRVE